MLSSFKKSPVEQETIGCYSIFQVGSLSYILIENPVFGLAIHVFTPSFIVRRLGKLLNNCYGALRLLMLCLLREGIHGVLPTGSSSPEEEAPFGGSTSPMLSAVCCVPHFSSPQRCLMAHRRAVDLWSIHWCLCSRADKPKLICRIC